MYFKPLIFLISLFSLLPITTSWWWGGGDNDNDKSKKDNLGQMNNLDILNKEKWIPDPSLVDASIGN